MPTSNAAVEMYATLKLYDRAYNRGRWAAFWRRLRRRPARLLDLAAQLATAQIRNRRFAGRFSIPLHQIRGSEGRADDFDSAFRPRTPHTEERWRSIARARLRGVELPPVELILIGEDYFVRDGHHRISVAAALGQHDIDAVVTVWEVAERRPLKEAVIAPQPSETPSGAITPARAYAR